MTLKIGDPAPDFTLPDQDGQPVRLSDLRGRQVIVYFYPKDDTPGCTTEAQAFTALADDFAKAGAVVVGVSRDTAAKHGKFRRKYGLDVLLGSDEDGSVTQAYGVWVEKSLYGRQYMGVERATFLIGPDGAIRQIWRKVKVAGHAEAVLAALTA